MGRNSEKSKRSAKSKAARHFLRKHRPKMRCPSPHARDLPRDHQCVVSLSLFCLPDHSREMTIRGKRHLVSPSFLWKEVPQRGGGSLMLSVEKECEICLPSYRHPERSRGIFFVSLFLRNAVCMKHRDPTSHGVRCFPLSAVLTFPDRSRMKKISRFRSK